MAVRGIRQPGSILTQPTSIAMLLVVCLTVMGCADLRRILDFKHQAAEAETIARIDGHIDTEGPTEGNLVVVLARVVEGRDLPLGVDSYVRVDPGSYAFAIAPGRYQVGAYEDRNRDGLLNPDERAKPFRDSKILEVGPGEEASLDILLSKGAIIEGMTEPIDVLALIERTPGEQRVFSLWAFSVRGEVCENLGAEKFGPTAGPRGLWQPMDFLNDELAGIYFLEAYDPDRIPVLFVHGISGFPQEFSTLIDGLDTERFQPWFYFYPSAFPLDTLSGHMTGLLKQLQIKHDFDELAIVAHSMGGLVSRGAILKYKDDTKRDDLRLFVSVSTPWGGDTKAKATKTARIALPGSFRDMNPSSDYLRWLFYEDEERKVVKLLPEESETHMIFSFRMSGSGRIANDGSVTVDSQTRAEAQEQARTIRAWNFGHVDILHSPQAVERLNRLLEDRF